MEIKVNRMYYDLSSVLYDQTHFQFLRIALKDAGWTEPFNKKIK